MEIPLTDEQAELLRRSRDRLGELREVLASAGAPEDERAALAESIRQLDQLFLLVVAGEFNSGKSTFINALLGKKLLAEGVTPTTSHIYLLRYGSEITQTPGDNGVWIQTAPAEMLRQISIVDTPGTNAIMREHEALTAEFIPRSDLVLFLTSTDRPFTESERAFLSNIKEWGKKIVLVVNKTDLLSDATDTEQVLNFVRQAAQNLLGETPVVFPVSSRLALAAKNGQPERWEESGFEALENYIQETLDDDGRFRLKLLNPLGVGLKLVRRQLAVAEEDLDALAEDNQLLKDIREQMTYYSDDMQKNFRGRLSEIDNILNDMERRGNAFFDDIMRVARIPDLIRSKRVEEAFEEEVVDDVPRQIELRVAELVDWMVEQDLRQWTAVADHLARRRDERDDRIVGQAGPREGTLAYDRQRLVDSIGLATRQAVDSYNKEKEAAELADAARTAVLNTGLAGVASAAGLGVAIAAGLHLTLLDVTGVLAGIAFATIGALIIPARRRKAKKELADKLASLRQRLVTSLTEQFSREMRRSTQRVEDTVAPFDRFVRSEQAKIEARHESLVELEAHIVGLRRHLGA